MFLKDGANEAGLAIESESANLDEDTKEELETNVVSYLFLICYIYVREGSLGVQCQGRIQEFFIAGGGGGSPNFGSERTVELFCGNEITSHRDDHVFLNLWAPVAVSAGNTALWAEANDQRRVPKNNYIFEYPWNLV